MYGYTLCIPKKSSVNTKEANIIVKIPWRHKASSQAIPSWAGKELQQSCWLLQVLAGQPPPGEPLPSAPPKGKWRGRHDLHSTFMAGLTRPLLQLRLLRWERTPSCVFSIRSSPALGHLHQDRCSSHCATCLHAPRVGRESQTQAVAGSSFNGALLTSVPEAKHVPNADWWAAQLLQLIFRAVLCSLLKGHVAAVSAVLRSSQRHLCLDVGQVLLGASVNLPLNWRFESIQKFIYWGMFQTEKGQVRFHGKTLSPVWLELLLQAVWLQSLDR